MWALPNPTPHHHYFESLTAIGDRAFDTGYSVLNTHYLVVRTPHSLSALTNRSMSSSTVPVFGRSRSASLSLSSALLRPS